MFIGGTCCQHGTISGIYQLGPVYSFNEAASGQSCQFSSALTSSSTFLTYGCPKSVLPFVCTLPSVDQRRPQPFLLVPRHYLASQERLGLTSWCRFF